MTWLKRWIPDLLIVAGVAWLVAGYTTRYPNDGQTFMTLGAATLTLGILMRLRQRSAP